jgi:phytoene dehydrogenase-like protein
MSRKIHIIGSGFSSLSAACYLAKAGHVVTVFEKNEDFGGRARQFKEDGFTFDMGPSWYWMPDVFEKFFNDFNKEAKDFYEKELSTWYLRLKYNFYESWSLRKIDESLFNIAQNYCQDGDFDKARQAYRQVVVRTDKIEYSKYYLVRSAAEVEELDRELANIAVMQEQLAGEVEDNKKANILFDIALAYRSIECIKKAKEQYEIIQTLDVREGIIKNAKKFSAGLDGA